MAAMKRVAKQPEGPRTTKGNEKEIGLQGFYITIAWTGEVHMPMEKFRRCMDRTI